MTITAVAFDPVTDEVVLFGVSSDGTVQQWDGLPPPNGIMLRWLHRPEVGFPHEGYDLFRAAVPDWQAVGWQQEAGSISGEMYAALNDGEVEMSCRKGFAFVPIPGPLPWWGIEIASDNPLTLNFPDPTWYVRVDSAPSSTAELVVSLIAGGQERIAASIHSGSFAEWRTRGVDEVVVSCASGGGQLVRVSYQPIHASRSWTHLAHLCLPVIDPSYPCSPQGPGTDEDVARARVPVAVDWQARYHAGFTDVRPYLIAAANHQQAAPVGPATSGDEPAPQLTWTPADALALASLDPHLARAMGLAYDDVAVALDGKAWAYRVVGRWRDGRTFVELAGSDPLAELAAAGFGLSADPSWIAVSRGISIDVPRDGRATLSLPRPTEELRVMVQTTTDVVWHALDPNGAELGSDQWPSGSRDVELTVGSAGSLTAAIVFDGPARFALTSLTLRTSVERESILPSVVAAPGAPAPLAPTSMEATIDQLGGTRAAMQARLRWDVSTAGAGGPLDALADGGIVLWQVGGSRLSADPTAPQPAVPAFDPAWLRFGGGTILVPPELTSSTATPPPPYVIDGPIEEGWWAWWARGVDLFGRISATSAPAVVAAIDNAIPPTPQLALGEYVQASLPAAYAASLAPSAPARRWAATQSGVDGVVVGWSWTPELATRCPDVDGFRVYGRRPNQTTGEWAGQTWGSSIASVGPVAVRFDGMLKSLTGGVATLQVSAVTPLGADAPPGPTATTAQSACTTDLTLDAGAGSLVGMSLVQGATTFKVVGNGAGDAALVIVEHPPTGPPVAGAARLDQASGAVGQIYTAVTDLTPPALGSNTNHRRVGGALDDGEPTHRLVVLGRLSTAAGAPLSFVVLRPVDGAGQPVGPLPTAGMAITWWPAYAFAIADTGFGPQTNDTTPVARAQVTASSVRRTATRPIESAPAVPPSTVTAVDVRPPPTPTLPLIASGPYCAELGSPADWYGTSRFTLNFASGGSTAGTAPVAGFHVQRAVGDALWRLDLGAHLVPTLVTHAFPSSSLPTDPTRKATVLADLQQVDAAIASAVNALSAAAAAALAAARAAGDREAAVIAIPVSARAGITAAYEALHVDAQQLLAGQASVSSGYTNLSAGPLPPTASSYADRLDGRARAHWFYRVVALSGAGVASAPSQPTPPICCPKVVPPLAPRLFSALADKAGKGVVLRWNRSPEPDVVRYLVLRTGDEAAAADHRLMTEVARVIADPTAAPSASEVVPTVEGALLAHVDPVPGGQPFWFRLAAEDDVGNRSEPSAVFRAQGVALPPDPPEWSPPLRTRTTIGLSWTHGSDQRLACLVERRPADGAPLWQVVSGGWLPRGVYALEDEPDGVDAAWEYRLRVRDRGDQAADTLPVLLVEAVP